MSAPKPFYLTTPIYYVNDAPHIGHAYTTLACDVLARFLRLDGYYVKFLTGTDEHGQKVEKSAAAAGEEPRPFVDRVSGNFRELADSMNFSHDDFIRTTEVRHQEAAWALWKELEAKEQIYLGTYSGWYSVRDEAFYAENELVDDKAPTGADVEWVEEPSYFFRLSEWQAPLLEFYETNPNFIAPPSRRNEVISFVKSGLLDLSVSRTSFTWGISVPDHAGHVIYVWLDALTNYLTGIGYPDTKFEEFSTFWPADIHIVGKDILRFHAVYWPAFLMAAGIMPPKRIFAHGWWTNEGQKISKSLGNIIDPLPLIKKYGLDPVRFFLIREVPFGKDGDFSHQAIVHRMNGDLANDFGNLVQRVLSMIHRNCEAAIPEPGKLTEADTAFLANIDAALSEMRSAMMEQAFHKALVILWKRIGEANRYVDAEAPWELKKKDPARMCTVLYVLAEAIRYIAILVQPVMPGSAKKILDQLAAPEDERSFAHLNSEHSLKPGASILKPEGVFPRYEAVD